MPPRPLNATAASLLGFLHEGPMTGWDLVAVAQQRIGNFWTLTQSQVYRELAAMAGAGLVELGRPGPRDRKPYLITEAGRVAFREWIDREPGLEQIRFPLLLTLMFAGHLPPGRLTQMVAAHRAVHAERLADYRRIREELDAATRVLFAAFALLGLIMLWRADQARRIRPSGSARPSASYVAHVGFTLVALFDAFIVILVLNSGAAVWLVAAAGVLIAVAGHFVLRGAGERLIGSTVD